MATRPDGWHASLVTLESDWARFTEADLVEATERLTRLSRTFRLRLLTAGEAAWDAPADPPSRELRESAAPGGRVGPYFPAIRGAERVSSSTALSPRGPLNVDTVPKAYTDSGVVWTVLSCTA